LPTTASLSELLGVSKSTVSRALKNDPQISEAKREEIQRVAAEIGYTPNAIARDLAQDKRGLVGFVLSESDNYFYQEHVQEFVKVASDRGLQTILFQVASDRTIEDILPRMLEYRLAGSVIIPQVQITAKAIQICRQNEISVVLLNRTPGDTLANSVLSNHAAGSYRLTKLLLMAGHERIAFIAGTVTPTFLGREAGLLSALAEARKKLFARVEGNFSYEDAYEATRRLLARRRKPDAISAASDLMAFAAIDAIREAGLRLRDDVSVVGFDNSRIGSWAAYNLTTIAQPIRQMFERSLDLICHPRPQTGSPEQIHIDGTLIVRGSARLAEDVTIVAPSDFERQET
jgi:LacI family transcriptional regulator